MQCPFCGWEDSKVVDSRDIDDSIRRRRECLNPACALRFTTYERVQAVALYVVKKDGRREEFARGKLLGGLRRACEKRPMGTDVIEQVAAEIEATLYARGDAEVPSSEIGELVMERLRELDEIAYVRFASVYRNFQDLDALHGLIENLMTSGARPGNAQLPLLDTPAYAPASGRLQPAAPTTGTRSRRPVRPVQAPVTLREQQAPGEQKPRKKA
jgi:transcriptional repressor NrdR